MNKNNITVFIFILLFVVPRVGAGIYYSSDINNAIEVVELAIEGEEKSEQKLELHDEIFNRTAQFNFGFDSRKIRCSFSLNKYISHFQDTLDIPPEFDFKS